MVLGTQWPLKIAQVVPILYSVQSSDEREKKAQKIAQMISILSPNDDSQKNRTSEKMLVLVFPKLFEHAKFLISLALQYECYFFRTDSQNFFLCCLVMDGQYYLLGLYCMNEMDAAFNSQFIKFVFQHLKDRFQYMLIGTCGGARPGDDIGSAHFITSAVKYDRGVIVSGGAFQLRGKCPLIQTVSPDIPAGDTTYSGNFLCKDLTIIPNADVRFLDMETFDFFSIGIGMQQRVLGAIRVVSDKPGQNYNEATRAAVDFDQCVRQFITKLKHSIDIHGYPVDFESFKNDVTAQFQKFFYGFAKWQESINYAWRDYMQANFIPNLVDEAQRKTGGNGFFVSLAQVLKEKMKNLPFCEKTRNK